MNKTKKSKILKLIGLIAISFAITACGGGSGSQAPVATSVNGVASKGPITGGEVKVYALRSDGSQGDQLGPTKKTNENGTYSVDIGNYSGNILVEVTGGTYTDEATGNLNQPNPGLRAALAEASGTVAVAVTPLTEIAVQSAATLTKENIERANSLVSSMVGTDIISTIPVDVSSVVPGTASQAQIEYGLMLAAISKMIDNGEATNVADAMSSISDDLSDGMLNTTGTTILTALNEFILDERNQSSVQTAGETNLDNAIEYIKDNAITPQPLNTDLAKAKAMVTDLRNTALSIYNYQGVGAPGIVETPFTNLATEIETVLTPELTAAVNKIGWILSLAPYLTPGIPQISTMNDETLEMTFSEDRRSFEFEIKDGTGTTTGSGTGTVNDTNSPTSGSMNFSLKTPRGQLTSSSSFVSTITSGSFTAVTLTGSMQAPGFELDYSQSGRKLSATFAKIPGTSGLGDVYPTGIVISGLAKTTTAQITGSIDIGPTIYSTVVGLPLPKNTTITGSFEELANGALTGVKFSGIITGAWTNADTYDLDLGETAQNFPRWSASFDGKIIAPSRPTVDAFLKVTQAAYKKLGLDVKYQSATTGAITFISGTGTLDLITDILTANLTNQDGLKVALTHDSAKPRDERLAGTISSAGGTKQADLYNLNGVPSVKYVDNYFESLF